MAKLEIVEVSEAQLNIWKEEHGNVFEIEAPVDDKGTTVKGYFRKPDLSTLGAASKYAESDPIKSGLILLQNCFLGGDNAFRNNDEVKFSAIVAINGIFKVREAKVKNL